MSHRPGQKTSAARASDSYPLVPLGDPSLPSRPPAGSATQTPPFYHPLLVHLRPTKHPPPLRLHPVTPRGRPPRLHSTATCREMDSLAFTSNPHYTHMHTPTRSHIPRVSRTSLRILALVLVNRHRRSLYGYSPPLPARFLPRFPSYKRAYLESALFASTPSVSSGLSLSPTQRCRKPSPRHRCCGPDGQWVQRTVVYFSWTETSLTLHVSPWRCLFRTCVNARRYREKRKNDRERSFDFFLVCRLI